TDGVGNRRNDQPRGGKRSRDLVLRNILDGCTEELFGHYPRHALIYASKRVVPTVLSLHRQTQSLTAADAHHRLQTSGKSLEIEDFHFDGRRPQVAIVMAQNPFLTARGLRVSGASDGDLLLHLR